MKKRVLLFVVTYCAERTVESVLSRIPPELADDPRLECEILVIDDSSQDKTFERAWRHQQDAGLFPTTVLSNPQNLGYGGNQKLGYRYAVDHGFDIVALLHGDGQYAPEELPRLIEPLLSNECDAVFGSRMLPPGRPLRSGMPLYKFVGNKVLSFLENRLSGMKLSEWHSGYRLYSCRALAAVPFELNSDDFDFDTDIILQLNHARLRIAELPIPTFYGNEICHVNGLLYGARILRSAVISRAQRFGVLYDPKFDIADSEPHYLPKFHFRSSHSLALKALSRGDRVLILGPGSGELVEPFAACGCEIVAVGHEQSFGLRQHISRFFAADLEEFDFNKLDALGCFDKVLVLDVIEHLSFPEALVRKLRACRATRESLLVFTAANVAFLPMRLGLLLGNFRYAKRGILDLTHRRLFTFSSFNRMLRQQGIQIIAQRGIPAPFVLALGDTRLARVFIWLNIVLIYLRRSLFSYQLYIEGRPTPTTSQLLERAVHLSAKRRRDLEATA